MAQRKEVAQGMLRELEEDGVTVIEDCFSSAEIAELRDQYDASWNDIKKNWKSLKWTTRRYKADTQPSLRFIGTDLYEGVECARYKDWLVTGVGKGRYDFADAKWQLPTVPTVLESLMRNQLKIEFGHALGGLPVLAKMQEKGEEASNGRWHRDTYSLYDDDQLDLLLPPVYFTILIPLQDMTDDDATTEFLLGSHKLSLTKERILTEEKLSMCCDEMRTRGRIRTVALKAGSICVFNGAVIHRGRAARHEAGLKEAQTDRKLIYGVFKKHWYDDEPEGAYETFPLDSTAFPVIPEPESEVKAAE